MLVCESARVSRGRRVRACLVYKLAPSSLSFLQKGQLFHNGRNGRETKATTAHHPIPSWIIQ